MGNNVPKNINYSINNNIDIDIYKESILYKSFEINLVNEEKYKDDSSETIVVLLCVVDKLIEYKYKDTNEYKKYKYNNLKNKILLKNLSRLF